MKKKSNYFIYIFIAVNLLFIFLQIYKQSNFVKLSYKKQRLEKEKDLLIQKRDNLNQKFLELKNPNAVKNAVIKDLNMKRVGINQVKKAIYE
ncbi:MAG: hypothetical protein P4L22_06235 [Candidatus Babeliales bacterium]|nr:hypothetical protein [Candidatus Babeliales bacterium]